jgi:hypothetical protein
LTVTLWLLLLLMLPGSALLAQNPAYGFALQLGDVGSDVSNSIAADANGNIYVTGVFNGTIDFDPGAGIVSLTAVDTGDAFVASYDAAGNYIWAFRLGGIQSTNSAFGNANEGRGISVDGSGNVVVTGLFSGTADFDPGVGTATRTAIGANGTGRDMFVARYSPTGNYLWAFQISGAGVQGLATDGSGNIIVTGDFGFSVDFDPGAGIASLKSANTQGGSRFVAKYSPSGTYLWAFKLDGGNGPQNLGNSVATTSLGIDGSGNIYVGGYFGGTVNVGGKGSLTSAGNRDLFVAKYTAAGRYSWAFRAGGTGDDLCNSVAADGSGNVYVTGTFEGTVDFNPGTGTTNLTSAGGADIFVARYNTSGAYLWAFRTGGTTSDDGVRSIAVDGSGDIYTVGGFVGVVDFDPGAGTANLDGDSFSMFIAKYTATGGYLWAVGMAGSAGTFGWGGRTLAIGGSGMVYISGSFANTVDFDPGVGTANLTSAGGPRDIFIAGYSEATLPRRSTAAGSYTPTELHVAPNPFTSNLGFRYSGASQPSRIQIIDMMGEVVETIESVAPDSEIRIGAKLSAGTYFVQFVQGEETHRVMVHKVK